MNQFLSKDPVKALDEIKARLYDRLTRSRHLLQRYEARENATEDLSPREIGYRTGIHEEIMYLERLLNDIENS